MKLLSHLGTILLGLLLIAVITPISQFLTVMTVNADIETATPVGWAVGILFAVVLALAVVRITARTRLVSKPNLVILYCMLTIAVPVMNLGLVRQMFLASKAVFKDYLENGTGTYRTAYDARRAEWFPTVPTREGLAWNKAERLLQLLQDPEGIKRRNAANRTLADAVAVEERRLARQAAEAATRPAGEASSAPASQPAGPNAKLLAAVKDIGVDGANRLLKQSPAKVLAALGLRAALEARLAETTAASAAAAGMLLQELADVDEQELSQLPEYLATMDPSSLDRIARQYWRMSPQQREELNQRKLKLRPRVKMLREAASALSSTESGDDYGKVRSQLEKAYLATFSRISEEKYDAIRSDFIYRLTRKERTAITMQNGQEGKPQQDVAAYEKTVWHDLPAQEMQAKRENSKAGVKGTLANLDVVLAKIPLKLYARPMLMWGSLITAIFLLLMCVAEWIRRKWIERENLAFPLVEIADGLIRHDSMLESAVDVHNPPPRSLAFSMVFLAGFAVAFLWVSLEAMGHYEFSSQVYEVSFNVSKTVFTSGPMKEMDKVFLVISPIVLGIAFLVSLEVSFSVWAIFVLYSLITWACKPPGGMQAPYAGYAGGMNYPFPMEQMLGATACLAGVSVYKMFRTGKSEHVALERKESFVPRPLQVAGLVLLPIAIFALFWNMGISGWQGMLFLAIVSVFVMAQTIAAARVRAETGLPTQHVSYEFAKFPMVFGLTGLTGAKIYTLFISAAFLPISLLFRTLPQHLENLELARRHRVNYRVIALAVLLAFLVAFGVGMGSFLVYAHYIGDKVGGWTVYTAGLPANTAPAAVANYALWVSHFMGEESLNRFDQPMTIRVIFVLIGLLAYGLLNYLRGRFARFPLHPLGYILLLSSIYYVMVSPYHKGGDASILDSTWLWGSALAAWLTKKLTIKYGGMNAYKRAKPFFVGLVVGAVVCIFAWNMLDLGCSIAAEYSDKPGAFVKHFLDKRPFSPRFY